MSNKIKIFVVNLFCIFLLFSILEMVSRSTSQVYQGNLFSWVNFFKEFRNAYPSEFNKELGWIPKKGLWFSNIFWNIDVTILEGGFRSNFPGRNYEIRSDRDQIVAVGDSFTFGGEVSDDQTWPAFLEKIIGMDVVNAGVSVYGIDQIYLRSKKILKEFKRPPKLMIVSFINDNIRRSELRVIYGKNKPFFEKDKSSEEFTLRDEHVFPMEGKQSRLQSILGFSYLFFRVLPRIQPKLFKSEEDIVVHNYGDKVACFLFKDLKKIAQEKNVKLLLLVQGNPAVDEEGDKMSVIIRCAVDNNIKILNLLPKLREIYKDNPALYKRMFVSHMLPIGNRFVAEEIRWFIQEQQLL
ncbi:MAG: hypothetical protein HQK52_01760 [Oligoflexia bacterium]|nr:hypothetical protein [Oligoflexia bacterium]